MTDQPIPIRLNCPECGALHIDEGDFTTKPHHTHSCQQCGMTWRPAVVCTVGVRFLPGFKNEDAWLPDEAELKQMVEDPRYWKHRDQAFIDKVAEGFRRLGPADQGATR